MSVVEWAQANNMPADEFKKHIYAAFASIVSVEIDERNADMVTMNYDFGDSKIVIVATKESVTDD